MAKKQLRVEQIIIRLEGSSLGSGDDGSTGTSALRGDRSTPLHICRRSIWF